MYYSTLTINRKETMKNSVRIMLEQRGLMLIGFGLIPPFSYRCPVTCL